MNETKVPGSYPVYASGLHEEIRKHGEAYILESDLASYFWQTKHDIDAAWWLKKRYGLHYIIKKVDGVRYYVFSKQTDIFGTPAPTNSGEGILVGIICAAVIVGIVLLVVSQR